MLAKKKKPRKEETKKPKSCSKAKIEWALQEVKQLSIEAEDFFHTMTNSLDKKEDKDG